MKTYKMYREKFPEFIKLIQKKGKLFGPVKRNDFHQYEEINSYENLDFDYERTQIALKKFLTPPRYATKIFNKDTIEEFLPERRKKFVIGPHPCEIHSVKILDRLFLGNRKDPYYARRRENLVIIGHSCFPDEKCFCQSTGTDMIEDGFDLFLTRLNNYYLIWVGSDEGLSIAIDAEELLDEEIDEKVIQEYVIWQQLRSKKFTCEVPYFKYLADIIELNYDSEVWEEFGEKCLSCGTCSMVCPTCNCFNVTDIISMSTEEGIRERMLDSCMLPYYSVVAGGHDFRPTRTDRIKLYYTHKLKEYIGKWGQPSCVGCGRCVEYCPRDINVLTVAKALYEEVGQTKEVLDL